MTDYKSYELLSHYNQFGAKNSTILDEILEHGDLDFQIPSNLPREGTSMKGYTVLHVALKRGDYEVFRMFVRSGADFTVKNDRGATVLHQAVESKSQKYIDSILSAHVSFNVLTNPRDDNGISHFHVACMANNVAAVELFLKNGVPIDETVHSDSDDFPGYTALHFAARHGCLQAARILLDRGASVSLKDARGLTPLHLAIERNVEIVDTRKNGKIIELISTRWDEESDDTKFSNLHVACTFEDTSRVEELLKHSINLEQRVAGNSPLWPGYTALHFAAHFNSETVVLLLKNNANFLAEDTSGVTPLDLCVQRYEVENLCRFMSLDPTLNDIRFTDGTTRLIDVILAMKNEKTLSNFLENIADTNMIVSSESSLWPGYTLLHLAITLPAGKKSESVYLARIKVCLDKSVDASVRDSRNSTALHLAFRLQKEAAVNVLFESHQRLVDSTDNDNLSLLHVACAAGNEVAVKNLLDNGANIHSAVAPSCKYCDFDISAGSTPLHIAVSKRSTHLVKLLVVDYGADVCARDANGLTPIHRVLVRGLKDNGNCSVLKEIASVLLFSEGLSECETSFGLGHLHVASYANNVTAIEKLIVTSGANIEATIILNDSFDEELNVLKTINGYTPLHLALKYECKEAIKALIQCGADVLAVPPKIGFELHEKHSDFLAAALMNELVSQESIKRRFGLTSLHAACATLDVDRARQLLDEGADPNARVHKDSPLWPGYTPLHFAVIKRDNYPMDDIVLMQKVLLERGADVTLTSSNNDTCLLNAFCRAAENYGVFQFSLSLLNNHHDFNVNPVNDKGWSHFHVACFLNRSAMVEEFLKCGVNVNQPIDYMSNIFGGWSPIHIAAYRKCNETVDLLIKYGADIHARNLRGRTPFHEAVNFDYYTYNGIPFPIALSRTPVTSLIKAGVDRLSMTPNGELAYEILVKSQRITSEVWASYNQGVSNSFNPLSDEGCIAMGIAHEIDVDTISENLIYNRLIKEAEKLSPDIMGRTPIHNVVSIWYPETSTEVYVKVMEQLIALNFDIDQQDLNGRTALHWAVKFRNLRAIRALLILGSDINVIDINHETPLSYLWEFYENCNFRFDAMEEEEDRLVFEAILSHMYKLHRVRIRVSKINDDLDASFQNSLAWSFAETKQLEDEVEKLKSQNVDCLQTTLWNFLPETCAIPSYPHMRLWKRQVIDNVLQNNRVLREKFPQFAGLLQLQYKKAVKRRASLVRAKNSFQVLIEYRLPDLCCNHVLTYLNHEDLENLIETLVLQKPRAPSTSLISELFSYMKFVRALLIERI